MNAMAARFLASESGGEVSSLLLEPENARALYVFAHGAGAGMQNAFMNALAGTLADQGIATFRYQFPYTEQGRRFPDTRPILYATVRSAVAFARKAVPDLPCYAGGKSMGGRMTSLAAAEAPLEGVQGIVFFGFPLHPAGNPGTERSDHLAEVSVRMLFLQGTKDALAELTLLSPIVAALGRRARLHTVEGADHSFHVARGSGRRDADVREELGRVMAAWIEERP
ncbi:MAG: alpha/beta hydrolase family protein [Longimicrobiales bacterium]